MHSRLAHPSPRRHASTRTPAWALVGLAHLGLLAVLWTLPPAADRSRPATQQQPLVVTLLQALRPDPPQPRPEAAPRPARLPPVTRSEPQAITLPSEPASTGAPSTATAAEPAAAPTPSSAPPPAALNLTLPRGASAAWRQRNPALDDPRSNTAKLTLEQKLANAMGGDGSWQMERLDNDHIRYRRGDECLLVTRSRAGQLELGNGAFRNAWMVGNC